MYDDVPLRSRRQFVTAASAAALLLATHRHLAWAEPVTGRPARGGSTPARIDALRLVTTASLDVVRRFYGETLGLGVVDTGPTELTIAGGATPITFVAAKSDGAAPFYHFAFNIPQNKLLAARAWQLDRTNLLPVFPRLRDPAFPNDVVHFRHWNAHSVFFFDPAGNVLEYIARHDLDNAVDGPFTTADILYASEIGLVVDDVPAAADGLKAAFDLEQYRGGSEAFTAIGDERGLLLVFKRGRNLSLGHGDPKHAAVFPTRVRVRGPSAVRHAVEGFPYEVTSG